MGNILDILNKGKEKLKKIDEMKNRVAKGGPLRIKTQLNNLERIKRQKEKLREDYINDVMFRRGEILDTLDFDRIQNKLDVTRRSIEEAQRAIKNADKASIIADMEREAIDFKENVANEDVDLVVNAINHYDDFNECLRNYTLEVISKDEEISNEKVNDIWNECLKPIDIAVLTRGTTIYESIDFHKNNAIVLIANANTVEDFEKISRDYYAALNNLFEKYSLQYRV